MELERDASVNRHLGHLPAGFGSYAGLGRAKLLNASSVHIDAVSERLAHLYGDRHAFSMRGAPGEGVHVSLAIPFQYSEPVAAD